MKLLEGNIEGESITWIVVIIFGMTSNVQALK